MDALRPPFDDVLVERIRRDGYAVIEGPADFAAVRARGFEMAGRFFCQAQGYKDGFRTPSFQGYMTPYPGVHEVFEMRENGRDAAYRVPEPVEASWLPLYAALNASARDVLRALSEHLTGSDHLLSLLDASTLRLLHYDRVSHAPVESVQAALPDHTDSSFITVAPRSTLAALEVRTFDTLEWREVEESMREQDLVVFVGDSLSRISNNYFRSVLHRPSAPRMRGKWPPRLTSPFFLRGRPDAILDVRACRTDLVGDVDPIVAEPVSLDRFADNVGGVRDKLPWRQSPYYASFRYG